MTKPSTSTPPKNPRRTDRRSDPRTFDERSIGWTGINLAEGAPSESIRSRVVESESALARIPKAHAERRSQTSRPWLQLDRFP